MAWSGRQRHEHDARPAGGGLGRGARADHRLAAGRAMLDLRAGQYAPGDHHGGIESLARAGLVVRLDRVLGNGEMLDEVIELLCLHAVSLADPAWENHDPGGPFVRIA